MDQIYLGNLQQVSNDKALVGLIHYTPFHAEYGIGQEQEELERTGKLIERSKLPTAQPAEFEVEQLCLNPLTGELWYEYVERPLSREEEQVIFQQKLKNADELYKEVVVSNKTVEELKQLKINQLKYLCSESIYIGFTSGENEFGYNANDQSNFTKRLATIAVGAPGPFQWKSINNGVVELTKEEFIQVVTDAETHQLEQQQKFWVLEQEVLEAETKEEVDSVNW